MDKADLVKYDRSHGVVFELYGHPEVRVEPYTEYGIGHKTKIHVDMRETEMIDAVHTLIEWIGKDAVLKAVEEHG